MKILLINDYATPTGGAELQMQLLREKFRERGYDARLFASDAMTNERYPPQADYLCRGSTGSNRAMLQSHNPYAARLLKKVLRDFRPDVVHVRIFLTQLSPAILPLLKNVPAIYHVVWHRPLCMTGTRLLPDGSICQQPPGKACRDSRCVPFRDWLPLNYQLQKFGKWKQVFDRIVTNNHYSKGLLESHGISPVKVIHNGVAPLPQRPPLEAAPLAAYAGRLTREKGVDVLLRAFAIVHNRLPEARLLITGDGPEMVALKNLALSLRIAHVVTFLGHLSTKQLARQMQAPWVQVLPSIWAEPFSNAALEAMMRGTAVIASNTGGFPEMIDHERTGILCPPGDPESLGSAILHMLSNPDTCESMGEAARTYALVHFHIDRSVNEFLHLYREIFIKPGIATTTKQVIKAFHH